MHTVASDGRGTAAQMAEAAMALGHEYIAITDHTQSLTVANGLDERRLLAQVHHLARLEDQLGALRIAAGTEVDILPDGTLDLDLDVLKRLDWVVASVHSELDMDGEAMTDRLVRAMETGVVDCLGHPTNRRLGQRPPSELDMDRLLKVARRLGVAVELNGNPYRMDLSDINCRKARELGVPVAVDTDAHAPEHLARQEFGLVTARRGWLEPRDVLNTQPWAVLAERRRDRFRTRGWAVEGRRPVPAPEPDVTLVRRGPAPTSEHWPEPEDLDEDEQDTEELEPTEDLPQRLAERPLPDDLRERLDEWLRTGDDPALEAALGDNPMQAAFNLVYAAESSALAPEESE
jgi:DNA polymerase (family 10)